MTTVIAIGRCPCCGLTARLQQEFCRQCIAAFGEHMATLIVRARNDKAFAQACLKSMSPAARKSFVKVLDRTPSKGSG
jgi:predicted amidophosphoribosyltransferase